MVGAVGQGGLVYARVAQDRGALRVHWGRIALRSAP
ncbi:FimD/PapC C-terminal domain-containing protein [Serratia sp. B1]|nr:FimD/PapC C-terminal domain-containing protein [Serratia sp. B1]